MCQVGWKHQKHPVAHRHHDLICILGRKFGNWRPDDAGLRSWVAKVDRLGSRVGTNILYAAQETVRVAMHCVRRAACVAIGPATRNLNLVLADF